MQYLVTTLPLFVMTISTFYRLTFVNIRHWMKTLSYELPMSLDISNIRIVVAVILRTRFTYTIQECMLSWYAANYKLLQKIGMHAPEGQIWVTDKSIRLSSVRKQIFRISWCYIFHEPVAEKLSISYLLTFFLTLHCIYVSFVFQRAWHIYTNSRILRAIYK